MIPTTYQENASTTNRLPAWFRQDIPDRTLLHQMKNLLEGLHLNTVCKSACCPNLGRCWSEAIATFLILGNICTRRCRFCAVENGKPLEVDRHEPENIAAAVKRLNLKYTVVTSVTRDDLNDEGAQQFVKTIYAIRKTTSKTKIEVLIPDFHCHVSRLKLIVQAEPDVISHNMETVRRLYLSVRPQADYNGSLNVLRTIKELRPSVILKSGFMVGLGETREEIEELMTDLLSAGCEMLTIGQYLAPSKSERHWPVRRFVPLKEFEDYHRQALGLGFKHVMSAPLVRSSFLAEQGYKECLKQK